LQKCLNHVLICYRKWWISVDEKVARVRAMVVSWAVCSGRKYVGGGWGESDRDGMTDYQKKRLGRDPRPSVM
jgi:hypothetical protein